MALAPAFIAPEPTFALVPPLGPTRPALVRPDDLGMGVLFDRVQDAIVAANLATREIVLWNAAAERLFGYTAAEATGRPIEILMPSAMAHVHRAAVERYRHTGRGLMIDANAPVEVPAITKAGVELRVQVALTEVPSPDGQRYAVAIMRDTTYRKQAELMRHEIERLRRVTDALLGALASTSNDGEEQEPARQEPMLPRHACEPQPVFRNGQDRQAYARPRHDGQVFGRWADGARPNCRPTTTEPLRGWSARLG